MIKTLFTTLLIFSCFLTFAQNDCTDNLNRARQLFDDGMIEDLPSLLIPCLEEGFSKEEKISAYKLLILSYLFDDNQTEAEIVILNFFDDFPNYEIRLDDPVEFIYLLESYQAVPMYSVYGSFGGNQSMLHIKNERSTSILPESKSFKFGGTGLSFTVGGAYNLDKYVKNLSANARIEFLQYKYKFEEENDNTAIVKFQEKQSRINIPLFVSYNIADLLPDFIVTPEVYLGSNFEFVTSPKGIPERDNLVEVPIIGSEDKIKNMRRGFESSLLIGSTFLYPLTKGEVFIDVHAKIGFSDQTTNIYSSNNYMWTYYHIDDDFSHHSLFFNIGYRYTFYKPTKIR